MPFPDPEPSGRDKRSKTRMRLAAASAILVVLGLLTASLWVAHLPPFPRVQRVPEVVGLTRDQAGMVIRALGFRHARWRPAPSTIEPRGFVISESPPGDASVR